MSKATESIVQKLNTRNLLVYLGNRCGYLTSVFDDYHGIVHELTDEAGDVDSNPALRKSLIYHADIMNCMMESTYMELNEIVVIIEREMENALQETTNIIDNLNERS